jgi:hypothetical protein
VEQMYFCSRATTNLTQYAKKIYERPPSICVRTCGNKIVQRSHC